MGVGREWGGSRDGVSWDAEYCPRGIGIAWLGSVNTVSLDLMEQHNSLSLGLLRNFIIKVSYLRSLKITIIIHLRLISYLTL